MSALRHVGIHADRLAPDRDNPRERAFAERWAWENDASESRFLLRSLMLKGEHDAFSPWSDTRVAVHTIEQRDAEIVATVVQWLGSNVGFSFVRDSLRKCGYVVRRETDAERAGLDEASRAADPL